MPSPRKTTHGGLSDPINVHHGELQYQQKQQEELQEPLNATFPLRLLPNTSTFLLHPHFHLERRPGLRAGEQRGGGRRGEVG